jgi:transmembrane sensor
MREYNVSDSLCEAIIAFYENNLTQVQAEELLVWIREDKENLHFFRETGKIWYASGLLSKKGFNTLEAWKTISVKIKENSKRPMPGKEFRISLSALYKYAAAALFFIALSTGSLFIFRKSADQPASGFVETVASKGSRSIITLADGSSVWLNSGTKLRYSSEFGQKSRELYLEGEAYFIVAEDKQIPFKVKTSDIYITALGTAFNVKAYSDESLIETTLEKGEVRIDRISSANHRTGSGPVFLKPNQKAIFDRTSSNLSVNDKDKSVNNIRKNQADKTRPVPIIVESLVDTKLSTSWKDSRWIFKSEKLNKLIPILERRYDVDIVFRDSILSNYKFTGILMEESLSQVLDALCMAAPISYEIQRNIVILYGNQNQEDRFQKTKKISN